VIPTFLIDWPVLLLIGVIFGFGVKNLPSGSVVKTHAFFSGLLVVGIFTAIVFWSYLLAPDWMFNYVVRASEVPTALVVLVLAFYFAAYAAGFLLKFKMQRLGRGALIGLILVLAAGCVIVPVAFGERYTKVGSADEFFNGTAIPLPESEVGKAPATLTLGLLPLGILLIWWSRREKF
jgi:hypothetical protein